MNQTTGGEGAFAAALADWLNDSRRPGNPPAEARGAEASREYRCENCGVIKAEHAYEAADFGRLTCRGCGGRVLVRGAGARSFFPSLRLTLPQPQAQFPQRLPRPPQVLPHQPVHMPEDQRQFAAGLARTVRQAVALPAAEVIGPPRQVQLADAPPARPAPRRVGAEEPPAQLPRDRPGWPSARPRSRPSPPAPSRPTPRSRPAAGAAWPGRSGRCGSAPSARCRRSAGSARCRGWPGRA
jgi:hypothetical protein